MTNEEINEAVAQKLGYQMLGEGGTSGHWPGDKDYCQSIEAAWEIVEHVNADKFELIKTSGFSTWGCAFKFQPGYPEDKTVTTYSSAADTAPLAICQAFLKLRED